LKQSRFVIYKEEIFSSVSFGIRESVPVLDLDL